MIVSTQFDGYQGFGPKFNPQSTVFGLSTWDQLFQFDFTKPSLTTIGKNPLVSRGAYSPGGRWLWSRYGRNTFDAHKPEIFDLRTNTKIKLKSKMGGGWSHFDGITLPRISFANNDNRFAILSRPRLLELVDNLVDSPNGVPTETRIELGKHGSSAISAMSCTDDWFLIANSLSAQRIIWSPQAAVPPKVIELPYDISRGGPVEDIVLSPSECVAMIRKSGTGYYVIPTGINIMVGSDTPCFNGYTDLSAMVPLAGVSTWKG